MSVYYQHIPAEDVAAADKEIAVIKNTTTADAWAKVTANP